MNDPFASAPAEEAQTEVPPAEQTPSVGTAYVDVKPRFPEGFPQSDSKVVLTLKGGSGFDAPWIVVHAADAADALGQLDDTMMSLMEKAQNAAKHFSGMGPARSSGGAPASAAPAGAQDAPAGAPPSPGAGWVFKSGVSKASGKPWKAWMPPQGSTEKPLFF